MPRKTAKKVRLGDKKHKKKVAWDVTNNRYVDCFSNKILKKLRKKKKCTSIGVKSEGAPIADNIYRAALKKIKKKLYFSKKYLAKIQF